MSTDDSDDADIIVGPREQLLHLIAEACEIEHTLMCSYLYAAFSLKVGDDTGLSPEEAAATQRWRQTMITVATDEMAHLLLMANLSLSLGAQPHLARPNFPVAPGYFPSGVVVKLTPFSSDTLQHFIYLERPQGLAQHDGAGFEHEREYQREDAYRGLMPSVQEYATVGRLYEALRTNLLASARRLGEVNLFIGATQRQFGQDSIELDGVAQITDLDSALGAIDTIVEQGEGSMSDREDSHYQRFLQIQSEYNALRDANPDFRPAWPVVENPVMRRPPEPDDKVFIDDPRSARVLDFANAVYGLLLRCLVQAFIAPDSARALKRSTLLSAAIDLMHVFSRVATLLTRLPASADHPGKNAGVTFTMLRAVDPLTSGPAERQLMGERCRELIAGARRLAVFVPAMGDVTPQLAKVAGAFDQV